MSDLQFSISKPGSSFYFIVVRELTLYDLNPFLFMETFLWPQYRLSWRMFCVHGRRMCSLLLLSRQLHKCQVV